MGREIFDDKFWQEVGTSGAGVTLCDRNCYKYAVHRRKGSRGGFQKTDGLGRCKAMGNAQVTPELSECLAPNQRKLK